MTNVAVVGGGNIGTLLAAELAFRGNEVRMFASDAPRWSREIEVYSPDDELLYRGRLAFATDDLAEAVRGADWVFVTHPSSRFGVLAPVLVPLVEAGQRICVVPGADAELFFADVVDRGATLLGLQRVHSIARLRERGRSVYQLGRKPSVQLASIPSDQAGHEAGELSHMLDMPVEALPNYLIETLTPSNPILHTARLASMFSGWYEGVSYPENILFYESWDDASSELLIACDRELQDLCREIELAGDVDLNAVRPLTEHYESPDAKAMTKKISHIPAFKGLGSPMREMSAGVWVPDFESRYFTADFGVGLKVISEMAVIFGVNVPNINNVLSWYESASGARIERVVRRNRAELLDMYKQ